MPPPVPAPQPPVSSLLQSQAVLQSFLDLYDKIMLNLMIKIKGEFVDCISIVIFMMLTL